MDKYKKLADMLLSVGNQGKSIPCLPMEVKEITGDSCTVLYGELELTEVRLKATITDGGGNKLLILPKPGSMVLVGSITGDFKDLAVLSVDEMQKLEYVQDGMELEIDSETGKILIKNQQTSLKDIFQQLADLLKQFKVTTPNGPSAALLPDTMAAVQQFETTFKLILK